MPKFKDAFQTTLGKRLPIDKLHNAIIESIARDNLLASSLDVKKSGDIYPIFILSSEDFDSPIPLFSHPYFFTTRSGEKVLATDMRLYLKKKGFDGTVRTLESSISSKVEYDLNRSRAILNMEWLSTNPELLRTNLWFSVTMFGRWISDIVNKAYAIDPRDQLCVAVAAIYYYQCLFFENKPDEDQLSIMRLQAGKCLSLEPKFIRDIYSKLPDVTGAESLPLVIKAATENVRLRDVNIVSLLTLVKNSWYGINSKDIIVAAIEHPPAWMSIVNAAMSEKTFRNSLIAKIAERAGKRGLAEDYLRSFKSIVSEYNLNQSRATLEEFGY